MSVKEHRQAAPRRVRFAVLTVSDTRTLDDDESGRLIVELVAAASHVATARTICKDEPADVARLVHEACARDDVDAVVLTGGTGFARRDSTHATLRELYQPEIPGFGELFRMLSFEEIGAAAMMSRASAGVVDGKPVFSLPGSKAAVRLGMSRLVLPETGHVLEQLAR